MNKPTERKEEIIFSAFSKYNFRFDSHNISNLSFLALIAMEILFVFAAKKQKD